MKQSNTWKTRLFIAASVVAASVASGTLFASMEDSPKMPTDFQRGSLANSMLVTKEPNSTGLLTGLHLIYVNQAGLDRLKHGGSTPYPEGTAFVDDVRLFSIDDGVYHQGGRKVLTVMVKDSKKYASTGGWGFQAWLGGDPTKPIVNDSVKQCFSCHVPEKANDYVFSTYLQ
jgi:Cytochrome P460